MITRVVVFPVLGRRWAFNALPLADTAAGTQHGEAVCLKQVWRRLRNAKSLGDRFELVSHYVSHKMHEKWIALDKAPVGSIRSRVHSVGNKLLARLEPSESFFKSVPKDANKVEIIFPSSISPRLVRRRVRHVAICGILFHRRYMYGSIALLPFTALLGVLPFPNIPLFWNLFRAHAHWRALQGSRKLLLLVADDGESSGFPLTESDDGDMQMEPDNGNSVDEKSKNTGKGYQCPWVLLPSEKLERLVTPVDVKCKAINDATIDVVSHEFNLDSTQILKWRDHKLSLIRAQ
eukprot:c26178_g2_i1 orf=154-1026(+)